jgi:hypothetical protein
MKDKGIIKLKIAIFLLVFLSFPVSLLAATIIFKWGNKIEGKIIEKADKYIRVDCEGSILRYNLEDIDSIDGVRVNLPLEEQKVTADSSVSVGQNYYVNKELGFRILSPEGWAIKTLPSIGVVFSDPGNEKIMMSITTDSAPVGQLNSDVKKQLKMGWFNQLKRNHVKYKFLSERDRNLRGIDAYEIVLRFTVRGLDFKNKLVTLIVGSRLYGIGYSCPEIDFKRIDEIVERGLVTFEVVK